MVRSRIIRIIVFITMTVIIFYLLLRSCIYYSDAAFYDKKIQTIFNDSRTVKTNDNENINKIGLCIDLQLNSGELVLDIVSNDKIVKKIIYDEGQVTEEYYTFDVTKDDNYYIVVNEEKGKDNCLDFEIEIHIDYYARGYWCAYKYLNNIIDFLGLSNYKERE